MRIRALLFIPALAAAALAIGVGGASAATLYTSSSHATPVSVGATADAIATSPVILTSVTSEINRCTTSTLHLVLDQNSGGTVVGTVVSGSVSNCAPNPATVTFTPAWRLTVTGNSTTIAPNLSWPATVANVRFDLLGGLYTGTLTTGLTAIQPEVGTAPVCLRAQDSGELAGPLTSNGRIDTNYCFEGGATGWSLGN